MKKCIAIILIQAVFILVQQTRISHHHAEIEDWRKAFTTMEQAATNAQAAAIEAQRLCGQAITAANFYKNHQ